MEFLLPKTLFGAAAAALLVLFAGTCLAQDDECKCNGCTNSSTALLVTSEDIISPVCEEGSVAALVLLRSIDDTGDYEVITWNEGATTLTDSVTSPYKYAAATVEDRDVQCYEVPAEDLPVIGDQTTIKVTLNCQWTRCNFRYDVQFWCYKTGVLDSDVGGGVQVLSDIDDTIVCPNPQGATDPHQFAGVDTRLEAKETYPGVAELLLGLALGIESPPSNATNTSSNSSLYNDSYVPTRPILLSARPREASVLSISQNSGINVYMEEVGKRNYHPTWGTNIDASMYGTIFDGTSFNEFGETKAKSYAEISSARPNTRFAFLGDNGQGDICAAQSMFQSSSGDQMVAVLIHLTQTPEESLSECEDPDTGAFALNLTESDKVHYHSTYSDAALWTYNQGLISCCSANNVFVAIEEWVACRCDGNCTFELPTGLSIQATRNETLLYCDELKADQLLLKSAVDECDAQGDCPQPEELPPVGTGASGGSSSSNVFVVSLLGVISIIGLL
jgi:hypothetical protein